MSFYGKIYQAGNSVEIDSNNITGDPWIIIAEDGDTWQLQHAPSQDKAIYVKMIAGNGKVYKIDIDQAGHITTITETTDQSFYVDDGKGNIQIFNSLGGATQ